MDIISACVQGSAKEVRILLQGIDEKTLNQRFWTLQGNYTPLCLACKYGHIEIVKMLLQHPLIDVNATDYMKRTPLYYACETGNFKIVELLTQDARVNLNHATEAEDTPLYIACNNGFFRIVVHLILEKKVEVNTIALQLLRAACKEGHSEVVNFLLKNAQININKYDSGGKTALNYACENSKLEVIKVLLANKNLNVNQRDGNGATAFYYACAQSCLPVIKCLLQDNRINVNLPDNLGFTPFAKACGQHDFKIVMLLIEDPRVNIHYADTHTRHTALQREIIVASSHLLKHELTGAVQKKHLRGADWLRLVADGKLDEVKAMTAKLRYRS